jgi:hypothetical protein
MRPIMQNLADQNRVNALPNYFSTSIRTPIESIPIPGFQTREQTISAPPQPHPNAPCVIHPAKFSPWST